eukprot:TRINITY_DN7238_c0_g1_i1.p1 TRINITY_DN7238_c0_g1~~TRINITY_DN7238_c0_g1_i1.p1  ORF type:complete len:219 (-),score=11.90 TRINITY_DN7238_c0_g1_i1:152-808(-)
MYEEALITTLLCVATSLTGIPTLVMLLKKRNYTIGVPAIFGLLSSAFYHAGDAWEQHYLHITRTKYRDFLGMTPGNWHRLDNVFAIIGMGSLFFHLSGERDKNTTSFFFSMLFGITLFFQEHSPWSLSHTIIPILLALAACVFLAIKNRKDRSIVYSRARLTIGFGLFGMSTIFFSSGLDEKADKYRLMHSLWHAFVGLSTYFFFTSWKEITPKTRSD